MTLHDSSRCGAADGGVADRTVTWRRLSGGAAGVALAALVVGAVGTALGTVIAGRLAEGVTWRLVAAFAACVVGGAVVDTVGRFLWATVADRAEGRLRDDLLDAALAQPLSALAEQAVGEVLDRVDDDTREVGSLVRIQGWMMLRALAQLGPMLVVAAVTWWPSAVLFPVFAAAALCSVRSLLPEIARRKVVEEAAWTDHAAALEEGIAGRDDLRTSLGQPFAIRRLAQLSSLVHARFADVVGLERRVILRTGLTLHALLAVTAVAGVALVAAGRLDVGQVVTLFLLTATFVGSVGRVAEQLPDLQAGLGAIVRLRQMLAVEPEPVGGRPLPAGPLDLEFRGTSFAYAEGGFGLRDVDLVVPAGQTLALVGRTGSGKSTLASLVSRAVDPRPGEVFLGGVDVLDLDVESLRHGVGVVTQRTEILAGSLAQNITLFADVPHSRVEEVVTRLGLTDWVAGLDGGLDTPLGPGGVSLSAGEEQLLAFARLLLRDVQVVVLDEATARMDPLTEARVVAAAERLLTGRTGILIAHRLTTIARADLVAVLADGAVVQAGPRVRLAAEPGPFHDLLEAAATAGDRAVPAASSPSETQLGAVRRRGEPPAVRDPGDGPSLARGVVHAVTTRPRWGLLAAGLFLVFSLTGASGGLTGYAWGHAVEQLGQGGVPGGWLAVVLVFVAAGPVALSVAVGRYPRWWVEVLLRVRMSVLVGQTAPRRLERAPAGEIAARAMDADRFVRYADRWVDAVNGAVIVAVTALTAGSWLAGVVLLVVLVLSALVAAVGRPLAGRSAARAASARALFGRVLVSALESARSVKLAGRTADVRRYVRGIDAGRVAAAVREHRVQAVLDGVPMVLVQVGAVVAWIAVLEGAWGLATALLLVSTLGGFEWFGRVAGAVVTEAPGTRAWQVATSRMAGGADLVSLPPGVDLVRGTAPEPPAVETTPLERVSLRGFVAVHEDGTLGVQDVDLDIARGELVLLVGQVGSGKSSLLRALAGLIDHRGELAWNGQAVADPEVFLRPGQVAYVAQTPRVLSGTFADNVQLGFARDFDEPVGAARLESDIAQAGGPHGLVGHRGVRLSGGQVQRLALARALATDAELLLADDVSSALDARTEMELWRALRERSSTVVGATSKRAALAQADRVVVLVDGRVAEVGPWSEVSRQWGHLAG